RQFSTYRAVRRSSVRPYAPSLGVPPQERSYGLQAGDQPHPVELVGFRWFSSNPAWYGVDWTSSSVALTLDCGSCGYDYRAPSLRLPRFPAMLLSALAFAAA